MIEKPSVLTIYREDGSYSWSKLHRRLETHDLAHYSVESTLGFDKAFYGIIANGFEISDFELPREQRPFAVRPENLSSEAIITEHIVNLLEVELNNTGLNANLLTELRTILNENNLPYQEKLTVELLEEMRQ